MKLVRAMKQVARLQGEIKDLQHRAQNCLSCDANNDFDEPLLPNLAQIEKKTDEVIDLKTRIMKANIENGMFSEILIIGELKKRLGFLRELNVQIGLAENRYGENTQVYKSQMTKMEKIELIQTCQNDINMKIDALDAFNAQTDV